MSLIRVLFSRPTLRTPRKSSALIINTVIILATLAVPELFPALAQAQQMKLLTPTTGWVTRFGSLYWTTDSGSHWKNITPIPPGRRYAGGVQSVFFLNEQEGWVIVSHPETIDLLTEKALRTRKTLYDIAQTADGGQTWSFLPLTYPQLPHWEREALAGPDDMFFLDSLHGWLVMAMTGSSNFAPGKLLATDDGGRNWKWVNGPGTIGKLLFTSNQHGWLAGGPGGLRLYATHDGCKTWQQVDLAPPPELHTSPQPVYEGPPLFVDAQHAYVAARYEGLAGAPSRLIVFSTADAGRTWKASRILQDSWEGGILHIALADSVLIVPSGSSPKAIRFATVHLAGELASSVVVSGEGVLGTTFADATHGLALAESGLLYTSDGGATWKNVTPWPVFRPSPTQTAPAGKQPQGEMEPVQPGISSPLSAQAAGGGGAAFHTSIHIGFDTACAPSAATMQSWWTYSPYYDVGIYLGGVNVSCKTNTNLIPDWVSTVTGKNQGWGLIPLWVGLQAPCNDAQSYSTFPYGDTEAHLAEDYSDGVTEATNAENKAGPLGLSRSVVYYNMENYNPNNSTCAAAVEKFLSGWVTKLKNDGYQAGVYANNAPVQQNVSNVSPQPDDVWITHFDSKATIFDPVVDDSKWPAGHRMRQYVLSNSTSRHYETFDNKQIEIDRDIEYAEVAGADGTKTYTYPDANFHELTDGADQVIPGGINNAYQGNNDNPFKFGQIAGSDYYSSTQTGSTYWWDNGSFTPINPPCGPGLNSPPPTDLSNFQVVGWNYDANYRGHGCLYNVHTGGTNTFDYTGAFDTELNGINDAGQIVGAYDLDGTSYTDHSFFDEGIGDTPSTLNITATASAAYGINGFGQIVGDFSDSNGNVHGYVYENGQIIQQIDCNNASWTGASAINNNELVVGTCDVRNVQEVFVYDLHNHKMVTQKPFTYPGSAGSRGDGINDSGQISGEWWSPMVLGFYVAPSH